MSDIQGPFRAELVWQALTDLLSAGLSAECDVQPVSENDFDGDSLILTPPSVRTFFADESADPLGDAQRLSYQATLRFVVICGDQDRGDVNRQALASLALAGDVKEVLTGARIVLKSGEESEPVRWVATGPVPVPGFGAAYAVSIEVPGLAQFPGPNATPEVS